MSIKITDKILSIHPYVSTTWSHVAALHVKGDVLAITLSDGDTLHIPNLSTDTIHSIFHYHTLYLENEQKPSFSQHNLPQSKECIEARFIEQGEPTIRFAVGPSLEGLGSIMQHNPAQANGPDLPPEILQKIGAIAKIVAPSDEVVLPKPEPHCNCFYCQIAKAVNPHPPSTASVVDEEPEVKEEELQFQQWSITQTGDKLFSVVNRLDEFEKYNVYLGQPLGCTCGKPNCEHLLAVLKS